ncbi:MAG TPA: hypothetical protein VG501_03420, partial [Rhizomicrobium sp.]|nr:hypothetical protein [Rhizomicrobium sp.]
MKKTGPAGEETKLLSRIAEALERLAPAKLSGASPKAGDAFVWEQDQGGLITVAQVASIALSLL